MKKIFFGLLLLFVVSTKSFAQDSTRYWYYPSQNVYYNEVTGDYWFYDQPMLKWEITKTLPVTYVLGDKPERYLITFKGPDVWKDNPAHKTKYKVKKDGTIKQKNR